MERDSNENVTDVGVILKKGNKMNSLHQKAVLVLNSCYEPLNICDAKRAMKLIVKGVAKAEETHPQLFYSGKMWDEYTGELVTVDFYLPSVIRLLEYRYIPMRTQIVTKNNIFGRDGNRCLYCGKTFAPRNLTLDHIIPRSRGGKSTWENLASCCSPCNKRKGDKMLHELKDMHLLQTPKPLNIHSSRFILRNHGVRDAKWRKYLYFENNTEQESK